MRRRERGRSRRGDRASARGAGRLQQHCWHDGDPSRGLRAVMDALAARYKAGESDRPEGAGSAAVHSRWFPRLSTALERGMWWRYRSALRALRGEFDVDPLTLADLPSYVTGRLFSAAS